MSSDGALNDLREEAERIVQKFSAQELVFSDYDFKWTPSDRDMDFAEWVADQDGGITELKTLLPDLDEERLSYIYQNPDEITQDELFEWARNLYTEPESDATMYVFVPIETAKGETGLAVIISYGDIPGGEYELFDVFANQGEADKAFEGTFWFC